MARCEAGEGPGWKGKLGLAGAQLSLWGRGTLTVCQQRIKNKNGCFGGYYGGWMRWEARKTCSRKTSQERGRGPNPGK